MKTLKLTSAVVIICCVFFTGCLQNQRTRKFGGKEELKLKPNEKFINITWKENNLWVLTEDTLTNIKYFRESSSWGVWEGEIIVKK